MISQSLSIKSSNRKNKKNIKITKNSYSTGSERFTVAKKAYSLAEAVGFKDALDKLNDVIDQTYFIATDTSTTMSKVISLHNEKVANDNK